MPLSDGTRVGEAVYWDEKTQKSRVRDKIDISLGHDKVEIPEDI